MRWKMAVANTKTAFTYGMRHGIKILLDALTNN